MDALFLQASSAAPASGIIVAGPYIVSGATMVMLLSVALKLGTWIGEFKSFRERYKEDQSKSSVLVTRNEFELSVKHIDKRFDEVGQQLQEIRRMERQ